MDDWFDFDHDGELEGHEVLEGVGRFMVGREIARVAFGHRIQQEENKTITLKEWLDGKRPAGYKPPQPRRWWQFWRKD